MSWIFPGCRTIMDLTTKHDIPLYIAAHTVFGSARSVFFSLHPKENVSPKYPLFFFFFFNKLGGGLIYLVPSGQTCL